MLVVSNSNSICVSDTNTNHIQLLMIIEMLPSVYYSPLIQDESELALP
jgi:hypothetical protein